MSKSILATMRSCREESGLLGSQDSSADLRSVGKRIHVGMDAHDSVLKKSRSTGIGIPRRQFRESQVRVVRHSCTRSSHAWRLISVDAC